MGKRIEYIDALKGFVMLLVVMSHINYHCFQLRDTFSFNNLSPLFMMPLFFFISGYLMYKPDRFLSFSARDWWGAIGKRLLQILVPTLVFMGIACLIKRISVPDILFDGFKGGFWFTFILPFFFIGWVLLYILFKPVSKKNENIFFILSLLLGILCYFGSEFLTSPYNPGRSEKINGLFCVYNLRYFVYYAFGAAARKYQDLFMRTVRNNIFNAVNLSLFFAGTVFRFMGSYSGLVKAILLFILGFSGTLLAYSVFLRYEDFFSKRTRTGRTLQYIGERTLDVYLIHGLILPVNLAFIGRFFYENPNPILEIFACALLAGLVIVVSLIISNICRTSDFISRLLFGKTLSK